jgi:hypothetical protein
MENILIAVDRGSIGISITFKGHFCALGILPDSVAGCPWAPPVANTVAGDRAVEVTAF